MFRQALKIVFPVVAVVSLTLGALVWSASNIAFAANQQGQLQASTTAMPAATEAPAMTEAPAATQAPAAPVVNATPTPAVLYGAGYPAPFYSPFYGNNSNRFDDEEIPGRNFKFRFEFRRDRR